VTECARDEALLSTRLVVSRNSDMTSVDTEVVPEHPHHAANRVLILTKCGLI
jgi:hypothetical protein